VLPVSFVVEERWLVMLSSPASPKLAFDFVPCGIASKGLQLAGDVDWEHHLRRPSWL